MANEWLRLWHDMPTDPKWRTIARISGQPISLVQAVFLHILVDASRNVTRGHATVTHEDLASALDVTEDQIKAILDAMQGRVLNGDEVTGWSKRQVKREDSETGAKSAAERKREQRERENSQHEISVVTQCHAASQEKPLDKDTDKNKNQPPLPPASEGKEIKKSTPIQFKTFLENCKASGEKLVSDYQPVWDFADKAGIPAEFVGICWDEFKRQHMPGGGNETRKQRDWRAHFRKCVEGNWYGIWAVGSDGQIVLTSKGKIAERVTA